MVLNHIQYGVQPAYLLEYLLVTAMMTILVMVLIFHLAPHDMEQRRLKFQKDMLTQQQLYGQPLEELQKELRWNDRL